MFLGFAHWCIVQLLVGSPSPDLMYPSSFNKTLIVDQKKSKD